MSNQDGKPTVLIICDYYLPGFESGGAMRTLVNMVDRLAEEFDFRIITRDHDGPLDRRPYETVRINEWNEIGAAEVYYLSPKQIRLQRLKQLIETVVPDVIYLNSFFSPLTIFVLTLRKLRRISSIPVILAPEGEFSAGALSLKPIRKRLYTFGAKFAGLLKGVFWKAASEAERVDLERVIDQTDNIFVAPNMPPAIVFDDYDVTGKPAKVVGSVNMVFLSRFMRKKNLNWLLQHLENVEGKFTIDIYGPIEEADYWRDARDIIERLPENITVASRGPVPHDKVASVLKCYHFFLLPTLGENFGHVFIEALAAGCPLVISDRTPWRNLKEKGIGWDLSIDDAADWVEIMNGCAKMDDVDYQQMSRRAREFAANWLSDPAIEDSNREVLRIGIGSGTASKSEF